MILAVVLPQSDGDPGRAIALAGAMAIVAGVVCIAAGLLKLGFITELLSKPIRYGYMNGIALTVLLSQAPKLFGFTVDEQGPLREGWAFIDGVLSGESNEMALLVGAVRWRRSCCCERWPRLPGVLIAVVGATAAVAAFHLTERADVSVLGTLPQGLPTPALPRIGVEDLGSIRPGRPRGGARVIRRHERAARALRGEDEHEVDPNQEMIGLGVANLAAACSRASRSAAARRARPWRKPQERRRSSPASSARGDRAAADRGARPARKPAQAALAAVVIAPAIGLIEFATCGGSIASSAGSSGCRSSASPASRVFGAIPGIGIAVVIAVIEFLWDGWRPHSAVLGASITSRAITTSRAYPKRSAFPAWCCSAGMRRCSSPMRSSLPTACARPWRARRRRCAGSRGGGAGDERRRHGGGRRGRTRRQPAHDGVELSFAEMKDPVKDKLKRFGLFARFGAESFIRPWARR
jgi:hypothetical protein